MMHLSRVSRTLILFGIALVLGLCAVAQSRTTFARQGQNQAFIPALGPGTQTPAPTATLPAGAFDMSAAKTKTYVAPRDILEITLPQIWQTTTIELNQYQFTLGDSGNPALEIRVWIDTLDHLFGESGGSVPTTAQGALKSISDNFSQSSSSSTGTKISDVAASKIGKLPAYAFTYSIPTSQYLPATTGEFRASQLPGDKIVLVRVQGSTDAYNKGIDALHKMVDSLVINAAFIPSPTPSLTPIALELTVTALQEQIDAIETQISALTPTATPSLTPSPRPTFAPVGTASASGKGGRFSGIAQATTSDGAPILGNANTKIVLMEVADFSCPHCLEYQPTILEIIDTLVRPGKVRLELRPVTFVGGKFSDTAAQAALCAGEQNRFWDMDEALLAIQEAQGYQSFTVDNLIQGAAQIGLDKTAFTKCMTSGETEKTVLSSRDLTQKLGVVGTPTLLYSTDGGATFNYFPDSSTADNRMQGGVPIETVNATLKSLGK